MDANGSQAAPARAARRGDGGIGRRAFLGAAAGVAGLGMLAYGIRTGSLGGRAGLPEEDFSLPPVPGLVGRDGRPLPGVTRRDFTGQVCVANVWASWCPYCRSEHTTLLAFARTTRVRFVGVTYRDKAEDARRYLEATGVPYAALGHDPEGRFSVWLGIRGVPTTLVFDRRGGLVRRLPGALDAERLVRELNPAIDDALARG